MKIETDWCSLVDVFSLESLFGCLRLLFNSTASNSFQRVQKLLLVQIRFKIAIHVFMTVLADATNCYQRPQLVHSLRRRIPNSPLRLLRFLRMVNGPKFWDFLSFFLYIRTTFPISEFWKRIGFKE